MRQADQSTGAVTAVPLPMSGRPALDPDAPADHDRERRRVPPTRSSSRSVPPERAGGRDRHLGG